jgi:hypothetical protein
MEKLRKEEAEVLQLRRDVEGLQQRLQETVDAAKRREEALTIQLETEANKHQKEMDFARKQMYGGASSSVTETICSPREEDRTMRSERSNACTGKTNP